jgi:glycosyltransferase involved in cell wall biosynthesis
MIAAADRWHLVTGEYPPRPGGVSDYTRIVAEGLADRGCDVHVWCPATPDAPPSHRGVTIHPVAGVWSNADLRRMTAEIEALPGPRRLVVQWVPHAFGRRSLNIAFCAWVRSRGRRGDRVDLMVHEAFHAFGEGSWRQDAAATVHRVMVTILLRATTRAWVAIPAWADRLRRYTWGRDVAFCWLPVPCNVAVDVNPAATAAVRAQLAGLSRIVGHFGTYSTHARHDLEAILPGVLGNDTATGVLLLGRDSEVFREAFVTRHPELRSRVMATGALEARPLSHALQACDLVAQPYRDGASARRGSLMAALAHGVPAVTTTGRLSEAIWRDSGAVVTRPAGDLEEFARAVVELAGDAARRQDLAERGRRLYAARFDASHTIAALLADTCEAA